MNKKIRVVELLLLIVTVIWGLNFTVVKYSLRELDPMSFNTFRFTLSILSMYIILRWSGQRMRVHKGDWPQMIGMGLLGHFIYQLLFIFGLDWTNAANGAVMLGTTPVWVALGARISFGKSLNRTAVAGILIAVAGVWLIMGGSEAGISLKADTVIGDLTMLASAAAFGLYTLFSRPLLGRYKPIQLATLVMFTGGIPVVLAGIPWAVQLDYSEISLISWVGVFYSGVLSIGLSFMLWNYGIRMVGAIRTSTFQNLVPVMGLFFGVVLLQEKLLLLQYAGAALTILGVVLARRSQ